MKRVILSVLIVISLVAGSIICHADNVANQPSTTSKLTVGIVDFSGYDTHTAQLKELEGAAIDANCNVVSNQAFSKEELIRVVENSDISLIMVHGMIEFGQHWFKTSAGTAAEQTCNALMKSNKIKRDVRANGEECYRNDESLYRKTKSGTEEWISESYLKNYNLNLPPNAIVFWGACETMSKNHNMADIFIGRGAKAFLGYANTTQLSSTSGREFITNMLKGLNIQQSISSVDGFINEFKLARGAGISEIAPLFEKLNWKVNNNDFGYQIVKLTPKAKDVDLAKVSFNKLFLSGDVENWDSENYLLSAKVGFIWSTQSQNPTFEEIDLDENADFCEVKEIRNTKSVTVGNRTYKKKVRTDFISKSLIFKYGVKYYYRAYINIDGHYEYGEVKSFELKDSEAELKKVLIKLYKDAGGDNWEYNTNWCSEKPVTQWYGVSKLSGTFFINLSNNNLTGKIEIINFQDKFKLNCNGNKLTSINLSGCTGLGSIECQNNQLIDLNLSGCSKLNSIICSDNKLQNINLTGCKDIKTLLCNNNYLTDIDLDCLSDKVYFQCQNNKITKEIPERFYRNYSFDAYDKRYEYDVERKLVNNNYELKTVWKDNGVGWYYPGEPSECLHNPPCELE